MGPEFHGAGEVEHGVVLTARDRMPGRGQAVACADEGTRQAATRYPVFRFLVVLDGLPHWLHGVRTRNRQAMRRLVVCAIAGALLGAALFAADSGSDCMKCAECLDDLYRCQEQRDNLWWGFVFGLGVAGTGWLAFRFNRGKWWLVGTLFGFALAGTATIRMWTTVCTPCNSICIGCPVPMPHPGGGYGTNGISGREFLVLDGNGIVRTRAHPTVAEPVAVR